MAKTDTQMEEKTKEDLATKSDDQSDSRLFLDVIGVMSHSVRTTLNAIVGYTEIILDGKLGQISPMQEQALKQVLKNSMETLDTVNSILDASKVEALKVEVLEGSRPLREALAKFEREVILKALQKTGFNQTKAAALLGMTRRILHYRMDKLKITEESQVTGEGKEEKTG